MGSLVLLAGCAVLPQGRGVTLEWMAPAEEQNLSGYRIYYWQAADRDRRSIDVTNSTLRKLEIRRLSAGTYYFAVAAYDENGDESRLSNVLRKTVE